MDIVEKSAPVMMTRRPFRDEERVWLHELGHVVLWPLDQVAMDLAGTAASGSRERELAGAAVFRALEPVTGRVTAALFRAAGRVRANSLIPDRTDWVLPRSGFERALELVPFENTVPLQHLHKPCLTYTLLGNRLGLKLGNASPEEQERALHILAKDLRAASAEIKPQTNK
ncbi:MAG: hypothetical protein ROY82_12680 [Truepera sp.]|nr:hypothetical protein [Truepera sp.]